MGPKSLPKPLQENLGKHDPKKFPPRGPGGPPKASKLDPKSGQNRPRSVQEKFGTPSGTASGTPVVPEALRDPPGTPPGPPRDPPGTLPGPPREPPGPPRDPSQDSPGISFGASPGPLSGSLPRNAAAVPRGPQHRRGRPHDGLKMTQEPPRSPPRPSRSHETLEDPPQMPPGPPKSPPRPPQDPQTSKHVPQLGLAGFAKRLELNADPLSCRDHPGRTLTEVAHLDVRPEKLTADPLSCRDHFGRALRCVDHLDVRSVKLNADPLSYRGHPGRTLHSGMWTT